MILWRIHDNWNHTHHCEFLLRDASEVELLPRDCAPGSIARTYDWSAYFTLDEDGEWVQAVF